ncbi:epidermal growth factor receptor substrate 15-like 1 [Mya arenaria]|uniref:epidermal growth factor receptor substrate 15-like 1 n=1 Tax=Mya arenaria TaxID=6604 RepID=UPI0022E508DF|nr:epidermal growth factor receptor substrate 15-like 1 [Mya arenaria]
MSAKKTLDITPVFNHRKSVALVDTAEELVDSLDNLSVCLRHIEEKYPPSKTTNPASKGDVVPDQNGSIYEKLMENLEVARDLTDILKREKWRLSRREMSVELRMGELEDYKSHLKSDMNDMNQTVEALSIRIVQLENSLCEAQELQEETEAAKQEAQDDLDTANKTIKELQNNKTDLAKEITMLTSQRKDSSMRNQFQEMSDKVEILVLENHQLKDIIREKDDTIENMEKRLRDIEVKERENVEHMNDMEKRLGELDIGNGEVSKAKRDSSEMSRQDSGYCGSIVDKPPGSTNLDGIMETTEVVYV